MKGVIIFSCLITFGIQYIHKFPGLEGAIQNTLAVFTQVFEQAQRDIFIKWPSDPNAMALMFCFLPEVSTSGKLPKAFGKMGKALLEMSKP